MGQAAFNRARLMTKDKEAGRPAIEKTAEEEGIPVDEQIENETVKEALPVPVAELTKRKGRPKKTE